MFDYRRGLPPLRSELDAAMHRVLESGRLVLGPETEQFEQEFASWAGAEHCVAVTSGTMALFAALKVCGVGAGDEVITVANTCVPTVAAIRMTGAAPVFVDVDADTLMMDIDLAAAAVTELTKCIVPVHLWGNAVDMPALMDIAREAGLYVIEDCAQAAGTRIDGQQVGLFGHLGCFSFYPTKNLGGYGDGGAILVNDVGLARALTEARVYGYRDGIAYSQGFNARISELQSAFLRVKLPHLMTANARRRANAARYLARMGTSVQAVRTTDGVTHCYHQFVLRHPRRAQLTDRLDRAGIEWDIHYPVPVHQMPAFREYARELPVTEQAAGEILSIPVHEHLEEHEIAAVIATLEE